MRFESWYLKKRFSKKKWVTAGLVLVVLSVAMLSAGPASIYFQVSQKVANTTSVEQTWVRVYSPQPLSQGNVTAVRGLNGVREVIPAVLEDVSMSIEGRNTTQYVYFVQSGEAQNLFGIFQLTPTEVTSQRGWLYFGYNAAIISGVPAGRSTQVFVPGIGNMTATTAGLTLSDSDFYVFGDAQTYWAIPNSNLKSGEYNYLFIVADSSSAADAIGKTLTAAHPGWNPYPPSQGSAASESALNAQLNPMLAFSVISWVFGMVVFATYIAREVSSRSRELVTLGALGASRSMLSRTLSYYLLILSCVGGVVGLVLCLSVLLPTTMAFIYGFAGYQSATTIAYTTFVVLAPVVVFDFAIVLFLRWRLGRLDMMSFLRSEM
jgi:ABC-type antimicrobial peptide transport system permease subunit